MRKYGMTNKNKSILPIDDVDLERHGCRCATAAASKVAGPAATSNSQWRLTTALLYVQF